MTRSHRLPIRFALACALALAIAAPAVAQTGEQKGTPAFTVGGKVTAIDVAKSTITIDSPNKEGGTFAVDPKAMITNGDKSIGLGDLKVGWWVGANGDLRGAKDAPEKVLTYIEVNDTP